MRSAGPKERVSLAGGTDYECQSGGGVGFSPKISGMRSAISLFMDLDGAGRRCFLLDSGESAEVGVVDGSDHGDGHGRKHPQQKTPQRHGVVGNVLERTVLLHRGKHDAPLVGDGQDDVAILISLVETDQDHASLLDAGEGIFLFLAGAVGFRLAEGVSHGGDGVVAGQDRILGGVAIEDDLGTLLIPVEIALGEEGHVAGAGAVDGLDVAARALVELGDVELDRGLAVQNRVPGEADQIVDRVAGGVVGVSGMGVDAIGDVRGSEFHDSTSC